jgi:two-component system cell cycle sensor histidine kinase/response regulator CckA
MSLNEPDRHELGDQDSYRRLAAFTVENMPDAVYWIRRNGAFAYVNLAACSMLGYTRDELLSRNIFDVNTALSQERWTEVWRALKDQGRRVFPSFHRTNAGRELAVEVTAYLLELDGEEYSCAIARDIGERRAVDDALKREHAFVESLVQTAPVMILVLDADGRVVRFNRYTEQTTGRPLENARGTRWLETFVPDSDRARVADLLKQSFAGANMGGVVYRIATANGQLRDIVWYDQLLYHEGSTSPGLLAVGRDITDERQLEQRLMQAEKMEAIGRLAGGVAHDFNNQLTGIGGWAELLSIQGSGNPTVTEGAERIKVAVKRAAELTSQLLAYARRGTVAAKPIDLHELVEEVSAMLQRSIGKNISIALSLNARPSRIVGDPSQLSNAVLNLAINGRDAMPDGGVLTIATESIADGFVDLTISDTGTGMSEEDQRRMFEPFFTTKEEGRGTGLGLAAVYGTVTSHGGSIAVTSALGQGTRIRIRFPVASGDADVIAHRPASKAQLPEGMRVLVIDDEETVREITTRLLKQLGCSVTAFENPFDAIEHYKSAWAETDAALVDMVMPWLDGRSTARALRRINPAAQVILVSGFSVDGTAQAALDEGARTFVHKPFTLDTLTDALMTVRSAR